MSEELILGVIGGLGPIATAHFMELVTVMTDANTDQEHLEMIIHSAPSIPDRTAHILDDTKPSPLPRMVAIGRKLAQQGAGYIAIPCITAHYFIEPLKAGVPVPLVNGVRETVAHLKEHGIKTAGIMATDGTIRTGIFRRELESQGICAVIPSQERQKDVMSLIYDNVKAGIPADMEKFRAVGKELFENGAQAIILGCTELSMIKRDYKIGPGYIDAMEVLAQSAVLACGKPLKDEYRHLITSEEV
jgi:aspartate racemase